MKKVILAIKSFFKSIGNGWNRFKSFIKHLLYKYIWRYILIAYHFLDDLWYKYVTPILAKVGNFLTHNWIYHYTSSEIRLFNFIKFKNTKRGRNMFYGFLFVSPWIIGFLIFTLYPLFHSLYLSFTVTYFHTAQWQTTFTGFNNYINILRDQTLPLLFLSYFGKMILAVPLVIVFSMMIAMLINQPIKGKGIWRTIFFLPVIIATGPVINDLTAQGAISLPSLEENTVILYVAQNLGSWIADPLMIVLEQLLLILWYAGIPTLIFLASLQKIDKSIYEASSIDGASPWDNFWKITLPSIKPFITVNVIYVVVSMSSLVEPGGILDTAKRHMSGGTTDAFWHGYGYASAIAWIYFFLMVVIMGIFVGLLSIKRKESR